MKKFYRNFNLDPIVIMFVLVRFKKILTEKVFHFNSTIVNSYCSLPQFDQKRGKTKSGYN